MVMVVLVMVVVLLVVVVVLWAVDLSANKPSWHPQLSMLTEWMNSGEYERACMSANDNGRTGNVEKVFVWLHSSRWCWWWWWWQWRWMETSTLQIWYRRWLLAIRTVKLMLSAQDRICAFALSKRPMSMEWKRKNDRLRNKVNKTNKQTVKSGNYMLRSILVVVVVVVVVCRARS